MNEKNEETSHEPKPLKDKITSEPPTCEHKKPGPLKGEVKLVLHTAYAQKLFLGFKPGKRSINLLQFSARLTEIWDAAEKDDPYADWYLLKIYDTVTKLQKDLASEIENYKSKLNNSHFSSSIDFKPFMSQQPAVESLWFRTQYGYLAATLVAHFDELMRIVLTANRVGILLDKSESVIRQAWLEKLLTLFRLPFNWKHLTITRADIKDQTELAKSAEEKMGSIPKPILMLDLRSPFSPKIKMP